MNVQDKYTEMTGKLPYKEAALEFEFTDEYVEWLEDQVKKLSLGVVSKSANTENKIKVDDPNAPWNWEKGSSEL